MKKLIYILFVVAFVSCAKEEKAKHPNIPTDHVLVNAQKDNEVIASKKAKPCPANNPHCNTTPPTDPPTDPPVTDTTDKPGCILLDFNGHDYPGGVWGTARFFNASGLTAEKVAYVLARVQSDYSAFTSLKVTTDEAVFNSYPEGHKNRVVITTSWEWYGQVGGVAYINSYTWLQNEPSFVLVHYCIIMKNTSAMRLAMKADTR